MHQCLLDSIKKTEQIIAYRKAELAQESGEFTRGFLQDSIDVWERCLATDKKMLEKSKELEKKVAALEVRVQEQQENKRIIVEIANPEISLLLNCGIERSNKSFIPKNPWLE
jgi:transcriptional regulator of acetoin/glycerol metabolism